MAAASRIVVTTKGARHAVVKVVEAVTVVVVEVGRGGRERGGHERDSRTAEDLDAEMDEYMSQKK
jgi:hypothetical protein